jgi:hypothetical protein
MANTKQLPLLHVRARKETVETEVMIGPTATRLIVGVLAITMIGLLAYTRAISPTDVLTFIRDTLLRALM